jgi:hypothetical protein
MGLMPTCTFYGAKIRKNERTPPILNYFSCMIFCSLGNFDYLRSRITNHKNYNDYAKNNSLLHGNDGCADAISAKYYGQV